MREIQVSEITKTVRQMCMDAAYHLPKDIYEGLKKGRETEESPVGCIVLDQIIKNAEIADAEDRPYCQDTGMTMVILQKLSMLVLQLVMLKVTFVNPL